MKTLTLTCNGPNSIADAVLPGYRVDLVITAANDITSKLFVKRRIKKYDGTTDDEFVAVASPTNIEDFPEDAPGEGSSFFRVDAISLASSDPTFLNSTMLIILQELRMLLAQETVLDAESTSTVFTITPTAVTSV